MKLTAEHISFIIKDLHSRGVILEGFQDEVTDHVCSAVEERMNQGERFADAYRQVLRSFGNTKGLQQIQTQTVNTQKTRVFMIRNYITIALRHILKGRLYSAVNVFTLSIGIAASILIALYVHNELSYDRWNPNADRIYRVDLEIKFNENHVILASSPAPMASTMQQDYAEVESAVRLTSVGAYLVRRNDVVENTREDHVIWTDSTFFDLFPVPVLKGNPKTALKEAGSIAISQSLADKYFPDGDPLGKSLMLDDTYNAKVTAVFEDMPSASHFQFDILIALVGDWPVAKRALSTAFVNENYNTYIKLRDDADAAGLQAKLPGFVAKYVGPSIADLLGSDFSMDKFLASGNKYDLTLMPLSEIHLGSDKIGEMGPNGSIVYVYLLEVIAVLILAIACVNFMNLSTARSTRRAREVGVRKAMGSLRGHLILQFLAEAGAITLFSVIIGVFLAWSLLPMFNHLASKELMMPFSTVSFYALLLLGIVIVGVLAGLYPAFIISSFRTPDVLKGKSPVIGGIGIRNSLVVFQFVISILMIIGTITVNRQLGYIQSKKLGFDKNQVILVKNGYALRPNAVSFKTEGLRLSGVEAGTMSGYVPVITGDSYRSATTFWKEGNAPDPENLVNAQSWDVDEDYISTFDMEIVKGRNFSKEGRADRYSIILNETAARMFGLGVDPMGKKVLTFADVPDAPLDRDSVNTYTVIGVVRDFHFSSMKENIRPVVFRLGESDGSFAFRFEAGKTAETIAGLEQAWKKISPAQPFQYSFLDEDFGNMYAAEHRLGQIFEVFAVLAIVIACLGLFAMTAFTAEQRSREIGIRKVLGASATSIFIMLSKGFGKLILIAFVLATPIAWYVVRWWLTGYSYRTEVGVSVYILAALVIVIIACIAMSFQSIKAAVADPVKALRNE